MVKLAQHLPWLVLFLPLLAAARHHPLSPPQTAQRRLSIAAVGIAFVSGSLVLFAALPDARRGWSSS
jgi:hypothetical protein